MTVSPPVPRAGIVVEVADQQVVVRYEPFDSELLGLAVGRVDMPDTLPRGDGEVVLDAVTHRAGQAGFDQLISRVASSSFEAIWALEATGYLLMDVGVTFARHLGEPIQTLGAASVEVRPASHEDVEILLETMLDVPWGSRYEADPAYDRRAVRVLQARWVRSSLSGRADHVLVGHVDGKPAGYVTCRLVDEDGDRVGEIDLVGTAPAFRGRGVAATIVSHSLAWFSQRVRLVTVRTQATNTIAAGVYERAGMTLRHSDMTFRRALTQRGGNP